LLCQAEPRTLKYLRTDTRRLSFDGGSVDFPAEWRDLKSDDASRFVARSPDDKTQATVSVFSFAQDLDETRARDEFNRVVALRMQAEQKGGGAGLVLSQPDFQGPHNGMITATYRGKEDSGRYFRARIAMRNGVCVIVYIEMIDGNVADLDEVSGDIFGSISIQGR
jgi:hypothetical protein